MKVWKKLGYPSQNDDHSIKWMVVRLPISLSKKIGLALLLKGTGTVATRVGPAAQFSSLSW